MGWCSYHAQYYKNGKVDRKREMDELLTGGNQVVLKSSMVGSTYYAAVKTIGENNVSVWACVAETCGQDRNDPYFNFGYKAISETSGPYRYDCPKSILDLLTETDNEHALRWRAACREKFAKPKLSALPVGTVIRFTIWDNTEYVLTKMAPNFQFKRTWWYNSSNNKYVPSRRIPDSFEIVK